MPSPTYHKALDVLSAYLPKEKATGILDRQLPKCSTTADKLTSAELTQMRTWILGAAGLYIADLGLRNQMQSQLESLQ